MSDEKRGKEERTGRALEDLNDDLQKTSTLSLLTSLLSLRHTESLNTSLLRIKMVEDECGTAG
jgi:hypothetical protein